MLIHDPGIDAGLVAQDDDSLWKLLVSAGGNTSQGNGTRGFYLRLLGYSKATSITTRIETSSDNLIISVGYFIPKQLPSQQGLKPNASSMA